MVLFTRLLQENMTEEERPKKIMYIYIYIIFIYTYT